jgi:hypothetical protein
MKSLASVVAVAALLAGAADDADAAKLKKNVVKGAINSFEDQSREALIDVDGSTSLSTGDVFAGFLRLDDRSAPTAKALADNELYIAFSLQVASITDVGGGTSIIGWAPTVTPGLTLDELLAGSIGGSVLPPQGIPGGAMAAAFSDIGSNLLAASPGDVNADGQTDFIDYIAHINTTGTLELVAGLGGLPTQIDDHFIGTISSASPILAPAGLGILNNLTLVGGSVFAGFHSGLSILTNLTGLGFAEIVPDLVEFLAGAGPVTFHDVGVFTGDLSGGCEVAQAPAFFGNSLPQFNPLCTPITLTGTVAATTGVSYEFYGVVDNADVSVAPIPEPATVALLGAGLLGLGAVRRRWRARA